MGEFQFYHYLMRILPTKICHLRNPHITPTSYSLPPVASISVSAYSLGCDVQLSHGNWVHAISKIFTKAYLLPGAHYTYLAHSTLSVWFIGMCVCVCVCVCVCLWMYACMWCVSFFLWARMCFLRFTCRSNCITS